MDNIFPEIDYWALSFCVLLGIIVVLVAPNFVEYLHNSEINRKERKEAELLEKRLAESIKKIKVEIPLFNIDGIKITK